jgi:choline dehydrogenase-like flavoprotein
MRARRQAAGGRGGQVLVLEAGGNDTSHIISDPNRWSLTLGTELGWQFVGEQSTRFEGRAIPYAMRKVLEPVSERYRNGVSIWVGWPP